MPRCQGETAEGTQCSRLVKEGTRYCFQHRGQAPDEPEIDLSSLGLLSRQRWTIALRKQLPKLLSLSALSAAILYLLQAAGILSDILGIAPIILPQPTEPMMGEFNVAIARFVVLDEDGDEIKSEDGENLAHFLHGRLELGMEDFELAIPYELRGPNEVGSIEGASRDERAEAAAEMATELNANVVIYGVVYQSELQPRFEPEFHVDYRGFEQAQEIVGPHEFGQAVQVDLPFSASQFQGIANPPLNARSQALSLLTLGLAYHSTGDLERALEFYEAAEAVEGLSRQDGKEVLLLLIGNVYSLLASQTRCNFAETQTHRSTAATYFEGAMELNPDYARALIGKAGVLYLQALGNPSLPGLNNALLDESATLFEQALAMPDQPTSANIRPKVSFGLGQIEMLQLLQAGESPAGAASRFQEVVDTFEAGNRALEELAGHAYARLALIERLQEERAQAIAHYERAVEVLANYSPYFKTDYRIRLGKVHVDAGQTAEADEICAVARDLALDLEEPKLVGQALACLAESARRREASAQAEQLFREAIAAVREQCPADAAGYYADIARLFLQQRDLPAAVVEYEAAAHVAESPFLQARYFALAGDQYAEMGRIDRAVDAYENALTKAEAHGDYEQIDAFRKRLDELETEQVP